MSYILIALGPSYLVLDLHEASDKVGKGSPHMSFAIRLN